MINASPTASPDTDPLAFLLTDENGEPLTENNGEFIELDTNRGAEQF